jgi:hypothetical protein
MPPGKQKSTLFLHKSKGTAQNYDMIFINCDWVVSRWQRSVHVYTNKKLNNIIIHKQTDTQNNTKIQSTQNRRQDIQNKKTNIRRTIIDKHENINIKQSLGYNKELKDHKANN